MPRSCRSAPGLGVQGLHDGFGIPSGHSEKGQRGAVRRTPSLFPVAECGHTDADHQSELGLRRPNLCSYRLNIGGPKLGPALCAVRGSITVPTAVMRSRGVLIPFRGIAAPTAYRLPGREQRQVPVPRRPTFQRLRSVVSQSAPLEACQSWSEGRVRAGFPDRA